MYPLIGNVLHAQKVFFIHISVLTEWNRNVDKIYYVHYGGETARYSPKHLKSKPSTYFGMDEFGIPIKLLFLSSIDYI
jgi:hypothetical protein